MTGLPILMFHGLDSGSEPSELTLPGDLRYVLREEAFEGILEALIGGGYSPVLLKDVGPWRRGEGSAPERPVVLTFDDGHVSNVTRALPILVKHGARAEFFVTSGFVGRPHHMTPSQVRLLADEGMGVGSHGSTHRFLTDLTAQEAARELAESKKALEDIAGRPVPAFSAPGGRIDGKTAGLAREAGYGIVCGSGSFVNSLERPLPVLGRFAVKRGDSAASVVRRIEGRGAWKERTVSLCADAAKRVLGNPAYGKLREGILGIGRR